METIHLPWEITRIKYKFLCQICQIIAILLATATALLISLQTTVTHLVETIHPRLEITPTKCKFLCPICQTIVPALILQAMAAIPAILLACQTIAATHILTQCQTLPITAIHTALPIQMLAHQIILHLAILAMPLISQVVVTALAIIQLLSAAMELLPHSLLLRPTTHTLIQVLIIIQAVIALALVLAPAPAPALVAPTQAL